MPDIRVEIKGNKEFVKAVRDYGKTAKDALGKALFLGATHTRNEAVASIQAHGSAGVTYKRRGVEHTASVAGNPPNTDTGNLVKNITTEKISGGYDVGSRKGAPYGAALEFGTSKIAPRPWLSPAYEKAVKIVLDKIRNSKAAGR